MITWGQLYQISVYKDSFTYFSNALATDENIQETLNAEITMRTIKTSLVAVVSENGSCII